MGFFDKIFGSKAAATKFSGQKMTVLAPIDSTVIPLEQLPDETFATAILGPGCGLEPTGDMVYAPFDGTVTTIADTLHAVGLMSDDGIEVLIHVGMDTVEMQGKSFEAQVKVDQKVKAGTPLLKIDLDAIRAAGHPTATALIVTNADDLPEMQIVGAASWPQALPCSNLKSNFYANSSGPERHFSEPLLSYFYKRFNFRAAARASTLLLVPSLW